MAKGAQTFPKKQTRDKLTGFLLAVFIVLVLSSFAVWQLTRVIIARSEQLIFEGDVSRIERIVKNATESATQSIDSYRALFSGRPEISFSDFVAAADVIEPHAKLSGIIAAGYLPQVKDADRATFEENMKNQKTLTQAGIKTYRIFPQGKRSQYLPLAYTAPFDLGSSAVLGYDYLTEDTRMAAVEKARDDGTIVVTPQLTVEQANQALGFLFFAPIYKNNLPVDTVDHRRAAFIGIVAEVLQAQDFFNAEIANAFISSGTQVAIFDGDQTSPFYKVNPLAAGVSVNPALTKESSITVADRTWRVQVKHVPQVTFMRTWAPTLELIAGILLSTLVVLAMRDLFAARGMAVAASNRVVADQGRRMADMQREMDELKKGRPRPGNS